MIATSNYLKRNRYMSDPESGVSLKPSCSWTIDEILENSNVQMLRSLFLEQHRDEIENGEYDVRDIERIKSNDHYLLNVMRCFKKEDHVTTAQIISFIRSCLQFRIELGVNDLTDNCAPDELKKSGVITWHGRDERNRRILLADCGRHQKGILVTETKKYVAYLLEQHYRKHLSSPGIISIFDFSHSGIHSFDLDVSQFLVNCLSNYFPGMVDILIIYEIPQSVMGVWKTTFASMPKDLQRKTKFLRRAEITSVAPASQLPPHMR